MERIAVNPPDTPAVGPFSHAIGYGGVLFCSGVLGVDPEHGKLVSSSVGDSPRASVAQVEQVDW